LLTLAGREHSSMTVRTPAIAPAKIDDRGFWLVA
jgi:hypothetical protein